MDCVDDTENGNVMSLNHITYCAWRWWKTHVFRRFAL